ncbi:hypothetical protein R1sor_017087 [Riccia sorocarpa]|uniref:Integrase catalytic domain-containing protein n=1 Tax=Riccia sorocarpa TaxID=122646 RepID=A0ABD3I9J7_9MARC
MASKYAARDSVSISRLTAGGDFQLWKFQMEILFGAKDLMKIVNGSETIEAANNVDEWKKQNETARMYICSAVEENVLRKLINCKTAVEIWSRLSSIHEQKAAENKHLLQARFFEYKMQPGDDISSHISAIESITNQLNALGEATSEASIITKVICTLPQQYRHVLSAWDNVPPTEQTLEKLQTCLLKEDLLLSSRQELDEAHSQALFSRKSKQGGRANDSREERKAAIREMKRTTKCHNCGEVEHWSQKDCDAWFLDGRASEHMTHHREWFHNLEPVEKGTWFLGVADDTQLPVEGIGDIEITCCANEEVRRAVLRGALYVPQLKKNLFSVGQAADKGFDTVYSKDTCRLVTTGDEVVINGMRHQGLYGLDIKAVSSQANIASSARSHENDLMLWHHRLGHVNLESIRRMKKEKMIDGLPEGLKEPLDDFCEACVLGKQHRLTFSMRAEHKRAEKPGEFFHTDVCSMETESIGGSKYFLLFKDDHSGYRFIFCIKRKSNEFQCFKDLQELVKMELNTEISGIKRIRSDRGGEFLAKKFASHLKAAGIFHEVSAPYSPEQNG